MRAGKAPDFQRLGDRSEDLLDLLGEDRAKAALVELLELLRGRWPRGCAATPRARGRRRSALPRCRRASRCRAPCWVIEAGEIVGDLVRSLRKPAAQAVEPTHAHSAVRWSPSRPVMRAVADLAARRAGDREPARSSSLWPLPLFSISTCCVEPTRPSSQASAAFAARLAKPRSAGLDDLARELRHARGGRVRARREGEDVRRDRRRNRRAISGCSGPFPQFRWESRRSGRRRSWRPVARP